MSQTSPLNLDSENLEAKDIAENFNSAQSEMEQDFGVVIPNDNAKQFADLPISEKDIASFFQGLGFVVSVFVHSKSVLLTDDEAAMLGEKGYPIAKRFLSSSNSLSVQTSIFLGCLLSVSLSKVAAYREDVRRKESENNESQPVK